MKLLLTLLAMFLEASCTSAVNPDKDAPVPLSNSSLAIYTTVILTSEKPRGSSNTELFIGKAAHSSLEMGNSSLFTKSTAPAPCALMTHTPAFDTGLPLPTAATQGVFFNSTGTPQATGGLRAPSAADFGDFSGSSPAPSLSSSSCLATIVLCYVAMVGVW